MYETEVGAAMERETFLHSLQNLYRDMERLERKKKRKIGNVGTPQQVQAYREYEHSAAS